MVMSLRIFGSTLIARSKAYLSELCSEKELIVEPCVSLPLNIQFHNPYRACHGLTLSPSPRTLHSSQFPEDPFAGQSRLLLSFDAGFIVAAPPLDLSKNS